MCKGSKMRGLYFWDGSHVIFHVSLASQEFLHKTKLRLLRLDHVNERFLVELDKQGFQESGVHNSSKYLSMFTHIYGIQQWWKLMGVDFISSILFMISLKEYKFIF